MPIVASQSQSLPRQNPPAGTHVARCYQVIDLGTHDKVWEGQSKKKHEIRVSWELPTETANFGKGHEEPFAVHKTYTLSLADNATLRGDLESWRGRPFSSAELEGFDIAKLIGAPCMVTVAHVEKKGKTYANVIAVVPVPKGMTVPSQVNSGVEYSIADHRQDIFDTLPEFIRELIETSDEWKSRGKIGAAPAAAASEAPDDDIPF
jgi:hypothetical protein